MIRSFIATLLLTTAVFAADPHSYSEPHRVQVTNMDFDWNIDLEKQSLDGTAVLTFNRSDKSANLILDTMALKIESVQIQESKNKWIDAKYTMGNIDEILGSKLEIELPKNKNVKAVKIKYAAMKDAVALQWNTALQTVSKRPFLTTNSETIAARSFFPCQDTPVIRTTYSAKVHLAQKDLMVVMSAKNNPTSVNANGEYAFNMEIPIPSYLIALGAGKLSFKSTGPRTGVYAEPEVIELAAKEFEDTEKMIQAAESLYGKYVWGRYDLLVLPASYPWGGMENPRLTFVTPTLITGKKDLVDVVAHEIAHSWSGNLVTNAQWDDTWINEGFTTYVQYRIIERLHDTATRRRDMALDKITLENDFLDKETLQPRDTVLKTNFEGRSSDDAFSLVPYTKGALFLNAIEEKVGKSAFDKFLKGYFAKYKFKSVNTDQVVAELSKIVDRDFLTKWINQEYFPSDMKPIESEKINRWNLLVKEFLENKKLPTDVDIADMTSKDRCYFLQAILGKVNLEQIKQLDQAFGFSSTQDPEVLTVWYQVTLPKNYSTTLATAPNFLGRVGRGKFVYPIYDALLASKQGKKLARATFEKNKTFYSPMVRNRVDKKINKIK
ncbi:MAG: M1 family metallopeptidase [Bdellovibrionota bacterium]